MRRHGALLVIDEVITGFRLGLTGAQGRLGVHGDISIYAKAIASGFPLAVLGATHRAARAGRSRRGEPLRHVQHGRLVAGRRGGHVAVPVDTDPYPEMERLTRRLTEGLEEAGSTRASRSPSTTSAGRCCRRASVRPARCAHRADFAANSDRLLLARFLELLQDLGVRPTSRGLWFVSSAHDDALVDRTLAAAAEALSRL